MRAWVLRVAALAALPMLVACDRPEPVAGGRPNVIVIVIDTMRADRAGWLGSERKVTPFLDRLAADSAIFTRAYAQAPETRPSVASLLTARHPRQHGILDFSAVLSPDEKTLPEVLQANGYRTSGFSANAGITALSGYDQGFRYYWSAPFLRKVTKERADVVNEKVLTWVDMQRSDVPLFLYVQYMEPHLPYAPPRRVLDALLEDRGRSRPERVLAHRFLRSEVGAKLSGTLRFASDQLAGVAAVQDAYDAEVRAVDGEIAALLDALDARGILDDAIVVVTADHGEEFKEHVRVGHGGFLFEETVHIPLLISARGRITPRRLDRVVSHVDIAPTILALLGIAPEPAFEGDDQSDRLTVPVWQAWLEDQLDVVRSWWTNDPSPAALITEPRTKKWGTAVGHDQALVVGNEKVILDHEGALHGYDLANDPGESDSAALGEARRDALHRRLVETRDALATRVIRDPRTTPLSEEQRAGLRALGYLADEE